MLTNREERQAPRKYKSYSEISRRKLLEAYKEGKDWKAVANACDIHIRTAQRIIASGVVQNKKRGGANR